MNQPIVKERKTEIKYLISLDAEQKLAKAGTFDKNISIFLGGFGSGKTAVAVMAALDLLFKKKIEIINITRPIDFSSTGYLSGNMDDKMKFHIMPVKENMYNCYNKEKIDKLFADGVIRIIPIDYMKGLTFTNACTIVDEFEDIPFKDFEKIVKRNGRGSKIIFTGDTEQTEIENSCITKVQCLQNYERVNFHILPSNYRDKDSQLILDYIKENSL